MIGGRGICGRFPDGGSSGGGCCSFEFKSEISPGGNMSPSGIAGNGAV